MVKGMRMIPTRVHGMMDYLAGALLIVSPWLFGLADESSTAKWTFIILGVVVIATSLMTNYELGLMHVLPMHLHLWADALVGLVRALSPWIVRLRRRHRHERMAAGGHHRHRR